MKKSRRRAAPSPAEALALARECTATAGSLSGGAASNALWALSYLGARDADAALALTRACAAGAGTLTSSTAANALHACAELGVSDAAALGALVGACAANVSSCSPSDARNALEALLKLGLLTPGSSGAALARAYADAGLAPPIPEGAVPVGMRRAATEAAATAEGEEEVGEPSSAASEAAEDLVFAAVECAPEAHVLELVRTTAGGAATIHPILAVRALIATAQLRVRGVDAEALALVTAVATAAREGALPSRAAAHALRAATDLGVHDAPLVAALSAAAFP